MEDEDLVSYDTSVIAKEKGYKGICAGFYSHRSTPLIEENADFFRGETHSDRISWSMVGRPTQSILKRWLWNFHQIEITVNISLKVHGGPKKKFIVTVNNWNKAEANISTLLRFYTVPHKHYPNFSSYEEALEKGLQEGFKLIEG